MSLKIKHKYNKTKDIPPIQKSHGIVIPQEIIIFIPLLILVYFISNFLAYLYVWFNMLIVTALFLRYCYLKNVEWFKPYKRIFNIIDTKRNQGLSKKVKVLNMMDNVLFTIFPSLNSQMEESNDEKMDCENEQDDYWDECDHNLYSKKNNKKKSNSWLGHKCQNNGPYQSLWGYWG